MAIAEPIQAVWARQLDVWSGLPADSPAWDDVDGFVSTLRDLAAARLRERNAGRDLLRENLEKLCREFATDLEYFEADACGWSAEAVHWNDAAELASRVADLHAELAGRRALQSQPAPHYTEARKLREQISAAEDAIFGHLAGIGERLAAGSTAPVAVAPAPVPAAAVQPAVPSPAPAAVEPPAIAVVKEPPGVLPAEPDADLHSVLDAPAGKYSVLTRAQERTILASSPGVGLALASGALGFEHLPEALTRLVAKSPGKGVYGAIPPAVSGEEEMRDWLGSFVASNPDATAIIAGQPIAVPTAEIVGRIEGALSYAAEHPEGNLSVVFYLAPGAVWTWLTLPRERWQALSDRLHPVFSLRPWSQEAVQDRLERQGKRYDSETCAQVMEATGGWSWCLDKLFDTCGALPDPRQAAEEMQRSLFGEGALHDEFLMRIGVRAETAANAVLELLRAEGEVPLDLITPETVNGEYTEDECRAAVDFLQSLSCAEPANGSLRLRPFLARVLGLE